MIKSKFISKKQSQKRLYRLYKISTSCSNAYLVEVAESAQNALALIQTDKKSAEKLFDRIIKANAGCEHLCDITEDFRRNSIY